MKRLPVFLCVVCALTVVALVCPARHALAADPSTSGLLGYWAFDDGTASSTVDSSGNGYTASLNSVVSWITGKIGTNAVSFSSSTNEYINTGADPITGTNATSTITVSGWIYQSGFGGSNAGKVFSNSKSLIQIGTTGRIAFSSDGGTTLANTATNAVPSLTWTHFALTRNISGQINWYINGSANGTANQNAGYMATGTTLYIGNRPNGSATQAWAGYIDDFRVYNRVLSGSEITDLYTAASSSPDTVAPNASNGLPTGTFPSDTTSVTLMASSTENATCKYGTTANTAYASIANTFTTTGTRSHEQTLSGLVGGTYNYYVRCQDLSPNANASTSDYRISFTITDITAPVISSISSTPATTTATVTWTTDEGADTQINYGLTSTYTASTTLNSTSVTSHSQTITGLRTGTTYHYRVRSTDPSGNASVSSDQTFTTASFAGTYPVVDLYVDMETGTVGASTTKEIMTTGTHGSNFSWSTTTPFTAMIMSTTSEQMLPIPVQVGSGGTVYTDSGTQGWSYDQTVPNQTASLSLSGAPYNTLSIAGFIIFGTPIPGGGQNQLWDHVQFNGTAGLGSQGAVLQQHLTTSGSLNEVYVHVASTSGSSAGVPIAVTQGQRYWYSMQWNKADLKVYLSLYNPDTWSLVGTSSDILTNDANQNGTVSGISILEDHSLTASSYIHHDDILVDWTNAKYPLVPDAYAPSVEVTVPSNSATLTGSSVTLTASSTDNVALAGVQFKLDTNTLMGSEDTSSPYTISWDSTGASNGSHTIVAVSRDTTGNYATSSPITVTVNNDSTAPTITSVSSDKTNGTYGVGEVVDIDVTFSEFVTSSGSVTVTLETGDTDRTCTFTVSSATTGTCNYTVQAGDTSSDLTVSSIAGTIVDGSSNPMTNLVPATNLAANKALVIDTTAPVRSAGSPTGTQSFGTASVNLTLTTDESATCKYSTNSGTAYGSMSAFGTTGGTSHSQTINSLSNGSSYTYYVKCQDGSANTNATDYSISFSVASDSTAPTVSMTAPSDTATVTGASVSLTATASDNDTVAGVQFKLDTNTLIGAEDTGSPYGVTWDSTGVADGSHTLIAVARDSTGNYATSSTVTVTVDNTAPVLSAGSPSTALSADTTSATISLTTNENATCKYGTTANTAYASIASTFGTTGGTTHSDTIGSLTNGTSYTYYVRCQDGSANTNSSDYTISFSVSSAVQNSGGGGGSSTGGTGSVSTIVSTTIVPPVTSSAVASFGIVSPQVREIQRLLNAHGYKLAVRGAGSPGLETSYFGPATLAAVKKFQCAVLKVCTGPQYGSVDSATVAALKNSPPTTIPGATTETPRFVRQLELNSSGPDVKRLQQFLNAHGFVVAASGPGSPGNETNLFGSATRTALIRFQEAYAADILAPYGLVRGNGFFGPKTIEKANLLLQ